MKLTEFFQQLKISISYSAFSSMVKTLGSPQLACNYYNNYSNIAKVLNKQQGALHATAYDKYQRLAKSHGLNVNYIEHWAVQLETNKDIIAEEIKGGDYEHSFKDLYLYKSHNEKKKVALSNQHLFFKVRLRK